jgi:predicted acyltransferase
MPAVRLESSRLQSLDVFRGLTVAGMLLVNNPGSWGDIYPPLEHAAWNGWTPTDLIFPFFLFIVGTAMAFALGRRLEQGVRARHLVGRIMWRGLLIIALGLFLNAIPHFRLDTMRYPGVLQRIGVVYLVAGSIFALTGPLAEALIAALLLVGYWLAMTRIGAPGLPVGSLDMEANLARYVDLKLFAGHMWRGTWDPEGLLSTFPAVATCLLGGLAGRWLRTDRSAGEKAAGLFVAGIGGILLGLLWNEWFPINKNLWTSSYVLFTAGMALQALGACYTIIEIWNIRWWEKPFLVLGTNALAAFALSGIWARFLVYWQVGQGEEGTSLQGWIYERWFASWAGPLNGSLAYAVATVLLFMALLAIPHRKGWFLRL